MFTDQFRYSPLPPEAEVIRADVRRFIAEHLRDYPLQKRADSWMGFDAGFSRKLGERGWIGMALPVSTAAVKPVFLPAMSLWKSCWPPVPPYRRTGFPIARAAFRFCSTAPSCKKIATYRPFAVANAFSALA
jgi:hypothetical protein